MYHRPLVSSLFALGFCSTLTFYVSSYVSSPRGGMRRGGEWWVTPYNGLHWEAPPERDTFLGIRAIKG